MSSELPASKSWPTTLKHSNRVQKHCELAMDKFTASRPSSDENSTLIRRCEKYFLNLHLSELHFRIGFGSKRVWKFDSTAESLLRKTAELLSKQAKTTSVGIMSSFLTRVVQIVSHKIHVRGRWIVWTWDSLTYWNPLIGLVLPDKLIHIN